jgi:hypothetical protein
VTNAVERAKAKQKWLWANDPQFRSRMYEYRYAKYTPEQCERLEERRRLAMDQEYRQLRQRCKMAFKNAQRRQRYQTDPEYRERERLRKADPEVRRRHKARKAEPEYREREKVRRRALRAAKTAALTALRELGLVRGYEIQSKESTP